MDSAQNLHRVPKIMTKRYFSKLNKIARIHYADLWASLLKQDCARRDHQRNGVERKLKVNVCVGSGKQFAGWIRDIQLDRQGPGRSVDRICGARYRGRKMAIRQF